jgi:hypothetical protein
VTNLKLDLLWKRFTQWWTVARLLGVLSLIIGLAGSIDGPIPYVIPGFEKFHHNLSPELVGIGITVLLIDAANEQRATRALKAQLIR